MPVAKGLVIDGQEMVQTKVYIPREDMTVVYEVAARLTAAGKRTSGADIVRRAVAEYAEQLRAPQS